MPFYVRDPFARLANVKSHSQGVTNAMAKAEDISAAPISATEAAALFRGLEASPGLVVAVSGGPDSTALLWLAARWRRALKAKRKPTLLALTVDHRLRQESAREARDVAALAQQLGVPHKTLRWNGRKPATGLPQAARLARYALLAKAARGIGATHVLTAHSRDDQAETVLIRMARGSGMTGLGGMAAAAPLFSSMPAKRTEEPLVLARPLLAIPKARLVATCHAAKLAFAEDPSNHDPRFTRPRIRTVLAALEQEGLGAPRLATLAGRLRRADQAIEVAVDAAQIAVSQRPWTAGIVFDAPLFDRLPAEIALRLLGRAAAFAGNEGPVELGKLEALLAALASRQGALRRTLAGALITGRDAMIVVETAPPRRTGAQSGRKSALTKHRRGKAARTESR
jgi:tRNA(Ile)-lysidine synthase